MIRIVLADDHKVVRIGLQALLSSEADLDVIGQTGDGLEAIRLADELLPDVMIVDLMMGGVSGLEVTRQVHKKYPQIGIVILSMHNNESYVLEALRSGAKAYVLKDSAPEELIKGIKEVRAGRRYLSSALSERAIEAYLQQSDGSPTGVLNELTTREREILQLTAQGYTNARIAEVLYISRRTVETHRANLMQKLDLHNHAQLIQYVVDNGLIPPKIDGPPQT
jgi:two-component system, NarL family, response regulator NreC